MASSPITSRQINGEKMETVTDFIFLGSKVTADGDCSQEIKRLFLLGRKAMTNLDSILKSRDITLPTKVHLVKAMVFPVAMYRCVNWTIKTAKHQRIDAFILWSFCTVLEKTLESPLDCKVIKAVNPKEINPEYSWKDWCWNWSSKSLTTWWEDLTHWKRHWCWERLKAGGEGGERGWDGWMASPTQWTWVWTNSGSWWWTRRPGMLQSRSSHKVGHDWGTEQQQHSTQK